MAWAVGLCILGTVVSYGLLTAALCKAAASADREAEEDYVRFRKQEGKT